MPWGWKFYAAVIFGAGFAWTVYVLWVAYVD